MAIPKYQETMLPLLQLLKDNKPYSSQEINERLVSHFKVTEEEETRPKPSGGQALFRNRWGWGRFYMKKAGLLERASTHDTKITKEGQEVLKSNPEKIDKKFLMNIPQFAEFMQKIKEKKSDEEQIEISENKSPEDKISDGVLEIRQNLEQEILEKIRQGSPYFFEQIVVDLLERMGYGKGTVTKRSNDGGIDGIISEDTLGFDKIYLQAKKWENDVRTNDIKQFAGSILDKKSKKGVFITTSDFSDGAKGYVNQIEPQIFLINGEKLANLLYEYNVGFQSGETVELKKIDDNYFSDQ